MHKPEKLILHFLTSSLHIFFPFNTTDQSHILLSFLSDTLTLLFFLFPQLQPSCLCLCFYPADLITSWTFIPKVLTFSPLQLHNPMTWQRKPYFMILPQSPILCKNLSETLPITQLSFWRFFFWTPVIVTWLVPDQFCFFLLPLLSSKEQAGKIEVYLM